MRCHSMSVSTPRARANRLLAGSLFAAAVASGNAVQAQNADVQVRIGAPANVVAGEQVTYSIDVGNGGQSAANGTTYTVDVAPPLQNPAFLNCNAGGAATPCPPTGSVINLPYAGSFTTLQSSSGITFQLVGTVPATNQQPIVVTVTANPPAAANDVNPANNQASVSTPVPVTLQQFDVD